MKSSVKVNAKLTLISFSVQPNKRGSSLPINCPWEILQYFFIWWVQYHFMFNRALKFIILNMLSQMGSCYGTKCTLITIPSCSLSCIKTFTTGRQVILKPISENDKIIFILTFRCVSNVLLLSLIWNVFYSRIEFLSLFYININIFRNLLWMLSRLKILLRSFIVLEVLST